ncbi:MAG: precorrin-6Y C5,15-methyltransferase subunit CbiT [Prochlorotrichaceae cyanobacterium]
MTSSRWPYVTPGIADNLFERLPGIPMSKREVRVLLLSQMRLKADSVIWDIGAGTGTIPIEVGLLCAQGTVIAVERDEEVANLIRRNCDLFGVHNVVVVEGSAPDCLADLNPAPDCVIVEGGRPIKVVLETAWIHLSAGGRIVATAASLDHLYGISEAFASLQVRNVEVVQSAINRLERRGNQQTLAALNPIFVLSGEKL